ncbi:MAG: hypothetical protein LBI43_07350 [Streptococcaceae bacterium]|jgi:hypothetical protein|nr:hypothetical protein [Streptococcaceae bacterium]
MGFFDLITGGNKTPRENGDKMTLSEETKNDKRIQKASITDGKSGNTFKASKTTYKNRTVETRSYPNER